MMFNCCTTPGRAHGGPEAGGWRANSQENPLFKRDIPNYEGKSFILQGNPVFRKVSSCNSSDRGPAQTLTVPDASTPSLGTPSIPLGTTSILPRFAFQCSIAIMSERAHAIPTYPFPVKADIVSYVLYLLCKYGSVSLLFDYSYHHHYYYYCH